jgi:hypothetical protein
MSNDISSALVSPQGGQIRTEHVLFDDPSLIPQLSPPLAPFNEDDNSLFSIPTENTTALTQTHNILK